MKNFFQFSFWKLIVALIVLLAAVPFIEIPALYACIALVGVSCPTTTWVVGFYVIFTLSQPVGILWWALVPGLFFSYTAACLILSLIKKEFFVTVGTTLAMSNQLKTVLATLSLIIVVLISLYFLWGALLTEEIWRCTAVCTLMYALSFLGPITLIFYIAFLKSKKDIFFWLTTIPFLILFTFILVYNQEILFSGI